MISSNALKYHKNEGFIFNQNFIVKVEKIRALINQIMKV